PVDGVCLVRGNPPVEKGATGDLIVREGRPTEPGKTPRDAHLPQKDVGDMLRVAKSYYDAADKLEKNGAYKHMPYSDPKMQKDIAVEWGVWTDPRIAKATGGEPATKDDLGKVIYKQAEKHGPVTPEKKKK